MRKVNQTVYQRLFLQAQEAKDQKMVKLANGILSAIGAIPEEDASFYNREELNQDIYDGLWKLASCVVKYYDLENVNAEKIHQSLEKVANEFMSEMEASLEIDNPAFSPLEEKLPGQK